MRKIIILSITLLITSYISNAQTIKTVGGIGSNYSTLKIAFDSINAGKVLGDIVLQITANTTESASAVLNASGSGSANYTSVLIYPTVSNLKIEGTLASSLIDLNGADNVTIDGRVNQTGSLSLVISNLESASSSARTLRFINSAENNTIQYCTIKGSTSSAGAGVIFFSTSTAGNGNTNNTIQYCNLTHAGSVRASNMIYSNGTASRQNKNITIKSNNFYDFLSPLRYSYGINIVANSDFWNIEGNSFYETSVFIPSAANEYSAIRLYTSDANNYEVRNNYIGGQSPECGGGSWTVKSSYGHYFRAIIIRNSDVDLTTIEANQIRNFNYTTTFYDPWDGINVYSGKVNITGNKIGDTTGTGSITVTATNPYLTSTLSGSTIGSVTIIGGGSGFAAPPTISFVGGGGSGATATAVLTDSVISSIIITNAGTGYTSAPEVRINGYGATHSTVHGIWLRTQSNVEVKNNLIGSIKTIGSSYYAFGLEGVYKPAGMLGNILVENNFFGSIATPNSLHASGTANNAITGQRIYGIYFQGSDTATIKNNIISNMNNGYSGTSNVSATIGIFSNRGNNIISNNIVCNIKTASGQTGYSATASLYGIGIANSSSGTTQTISGNEVYNLNNTHSSARVDVYGVYFNGPNDVFNQVSENFVHDIEIQSSNNGSSVDGILLYAGKLNVFNNIVTLGETITRGHLLYGIWDNGSSLSDLNLYFNTVKLSGTITGTTASTYALWSQKNTTTRNFRNNILVNTRSGGTTGKHYAIRVAGITNLTINYNNYYAPSGVLGSLTTDILNLTAWKSATSQDVNSYNTDPLFINTGAGYSKYYPTIPQIGATGTGVLEDYTYQSRSSLEPKIGALEINEYIWVGSLDPITGTDFNTASNWETSVIPNEGANIKFRTTPMALNHCYLDQHRIVGSVTNGSDKNLVLNGQKLSVKSILDFTSSGKIDGTSSNSGIAFIGIYQQTILSSIFITNQVDSLIISNSSGVLLNGNFTVVKDLKLNTGSFSISANDLTLGGTISTISGSLVGGNTSSIFFEGAGASTNLASITLKKLSVNRSNGISLTGNVTIQDELTLTNGTLDISSNSLIINGNTLSRTTGNINASNASAILLFQNTSNISLPASVFLGSVNKLTINGAGLTANSDISISNELNLQSSNPSSTKGLLDMGTSNTLTMGASAITSGIGDVIGKIKRTTIVENTSYTFGSQYTSITFTGGTGIQLPNELLFVVKIGESHPIRSGSMNRYYQIIRSGSQIGSAPTRFNLTLRYLDSELNSNNENNLVFWDHHVTYGGITPHEHGQSSQNTTLNTITLASHGIGYLVQNEYQASQEGVAPLNYSKIWMISERISLSGDSIFVWLGTDTDDPNDWTKNNNWQDNISPTNAIIAGVPATKHYVYIPNTTEKPTLPTNDTTTLKFLSIYDGGVLNGRNGKMLRAQYIRIYEGGQYNAGTSTIEVLGSLDTNNGNVSWNNHGIFDAGTSNVRFLNANSALSGSTNFHAVEIATGCKLSMVDGSVMRIGNSITNNGILNTINLGATTVEYNGVGSYENQTVVSTEGGKYSTLILSGSGTKTLPVGVSEIMGDFEILESASSSGVTPLTIFGNVTIGENATFSTGSFNHQFKGDFENNGTFNASSGKSILFNGSNAQYITGVAKSIFDILETNNSNGLFMQANVDIENELTLTSGNLNVGDFTLGINGTVNITSKIDVTTQSSLSFGGTLAYTIPNNLFVNPPSINNFTINKSGGLTLGNQNFTINGTLDLINGELNAEGKTVTINGDITRTTGTLLSNSSTYLIFDENTNMLTFPNNMFSTPVLDKLMMNRAGGITLGNQSITITNKLVLSDGLITTNGSNIIIFNASASVGTTLANFTSGSENSYINGCARKIGNSAFTFPLGNIGAYAPMSISAADGGGNITEHFTACYYLQNPHPTYSNSSLDTGVNHVSNMEYWTLTRSDGGTNSVNATLSWDTRSGGISNLDELIITHWNSSTSKWESKGNISTTGDNTSGTITSNLVSDFSPFTLGSIKRSSNPLPVSLTNFEVICLNNHPLIRWSTASETNNNYFEVQKSINGINWITIERKNGKGNSNQLINYECIDKSTSNSSKVYYRIKQVDFDGKFSISNSIVNQNCNEILKGIIISPNPSSGKINITYSGDIQQVQSVEIYNSLGEKLMYFNQFQSSLDLTNYANGTYYIYLNLISNRIVEKIVIQK